MSAQRRIGARSPKLVSAELKAKLEAGEPSVNHMEQMAMDMGRLLEIAFPALTAEAPRLRASGFVSRMREGGRVLFDAWGQDAPARAQSHPSDTVRGWGAMAVACDPERSMANRLAALRPFANDAHFAVREWAWLALRPAVIADPGQALHLLAPWTAEYSPWLRRFASEATRPRGVWSTHVPELKRRPEEAEILLTGLRADTSDYVQDSVANWLNDASRTRPDWVRRVCSEWLAADPSAATARICLRGQRTLRRGV